MLRFRLFWLIAINTAFVPFHAQENKNDSIPSNDSISTYHLREVTVEPTHIKMVHKNDTIIFDAAAFDLPEGSMLNALIRQMPGVKLGNDGVVTVNGRRVDYLLLNGKDFFKGNNKALLDNLPHYTVKNVRVYEKETDKSKYVGRSIEQRDYVMDVYLKRAYQKSYLANTEVGIATSERYLTRAFGSRLSEQSNLSAYLNLNNINETRRPDSSGEWTPENAPTGKRATKDLGFDFVADKERYKEVLNVGGKIADKQEASENRITDFNSTGSFLRFNDSHSSNRDRSISLDNIFQLKLPFWMEVATSIQMGDNKAAGQSREAIFNEEITNYDENKAVLDSTFLQTPPSDLLRKLVNRNDYRDITKHTYCNLWQKVLTNTKLPWGDNLEFEVNGIYNQIKYKNFQDYRLDYFSSQQMADHRNRYFDNPMKNYQWEGRGEYFRNFSNGWTGRFYTRYKQHTQKDDNSVYRLDRLEGWTNGTHPLGKLPPNDSLMNLAYSQEESVYSRHHTKTSQSGLNLSYDRRTDSTSRTLRIQLPLYVQKEHLHYRKDHEEQQAKRTKIYLNGEISLNMWWDRYRRNLTAKIAHTTDLPKIKNLITISDDRDPLKIRLGNPNLKTSHRYEAETYYYYSSNSSRWGGYGRIGGTYKSNPIHQGFSYNPQTGVYTLQEVNGDKFLSGNFTTGIMAYLDKKQAWYLGYTAFLQHNKAQTAELGTDSSSFVLYDLNLTYTLHNIELKYSKGRLNSSLNVQYIFQHVTYGQPLGTNYNIHTKTLRHNLQYTIPILELQLSNQLSWHYNKNTLSGMPSRKNLIWNVYASRCFLKDKSLILKFSAFDILGDMNEQYSYAADNSLVSGANERLNRYFMLSLAWQFGKESKKQ